MSAQHPAGGCFLSAIKSSKLARQGNKMGFDILLHPTNSRNQLVIQLLVVCNFPTSITHNTRCTCDSCQLLLFLTVHWLLCCRGRGADLS
jgi:hypothetical protein